MAVCANCKKSLSCGCQKRKASDGASVCTNCIGAYESKKNILRTPVAPVATIQTPQVWSEEEIKAGVERLNVWRNKLKS